MRTKFIQAAKSPHRKCAVHSLVLLGLAASATAPDKSSANGFLLPNQDPEAIARGDAFAATADNPSAIYYNPAGITQLSGENIRVGLYMISPGVKYTSPDGATAKANSDFQPVPQVYATCSLPNTPISLGLGIYVPYGLSINWGDNAPFNTIAQSGNLTYVTINPVVAWRVCQTLSVAIGPTINYSQASFKQAFFYSPLAPLGQFSVKGDGTDLGFNAGILWQPHPMVSFGINYRSPTSIVYSGNSEFSPVAPSTSTTATIKFPQYVVGGVSFRPTTNWNVEVDVNWTDWDTEKQIVFNSPSFGDLALPLDFKSSFTYDFGVTRQLGKGYFASVGYIYSQNSSPDQNFTPLIPDANLQLGGIGFGHHGQRWDWAVGYQFAFNAGRTVSGNANPLADGTYRIFNNAFNVATTYKF
ncbi:MAG: outer membrane protein transport protein [Verrucomicrobiota bacterium]